MEVKAITKYVRISPLKARDVARNIQGLPVSAALDMLTYTPRKAAYLVGKTLKSAIANAENNHDMAVDNLVIKEAVVGDGPTLKRWKPRARGGAAPIKKRTSHIFITVSDEIEQPVSTKKSGKTKKKQRMARATATSKLIKQMEKAGARGAPVAAEDEGEASVAAEPEGDVKKEEAESEVRDDVLPVVEAEMASDDASVEGADDSGSDAGEETKES